eukprot:369580-Rhodomonas_salina.1
MGMRGGTISLNSSSICHTPDTHCLSTAMRQIRTLSVLLCAGYALSQYCYAPDTRCLSTAMRRIRTVS